MDCPDIVTFSRSWVGIEPWTRQEEILRAVQDCVREDAERSRVIVRSGHKIGKALGLDTPLPTPSGWTTMGAVREGDELLDETGQPCRVVRAFDVLLGRPCYEVVLDDGTAIVADGEHEWPVWGFSSPGERLVTTHALARSLALRAAPAPHLGDQRRIARIRPVPSVPVRCLQVDSPSHLFLCSRAFVPTHNSTAASIIALWWVKTQPGGRCVITAPSTRQVEKVLWYEIKRLYNEAKRLGHPLGGHLYAQPDRGLTYPDGRQIFGFSTDEPDRFSGISGNVLYLVDEGSGVAEKIYEAIEGNRAGGAPLVVFGNPTQAHGTFYEAFNNPRKREEWNRIHISSEEAARYQAETGEKLGNLATHRWVEEKRREWGEGSLLWNVRVAGEFPEQSQKALIGLRLVEEARARWDDFVYGLLARFAPKPLESCLDTFDLCRTLELARRQARLSRDQLTEVEQKLLSGSEHQLQIGVDVARYGSDSTSLTARRGAFCFPLVECHSMDGVEVAGKALELARLLRVEHVQENPYFNDGPPTERPRVKYDGIGPGWSAYDHAHHHHRGEYEPENVQVSEKATDETSLTIRDQCWQAAKEWLAAGGMLPPDDLLEGELLAPDYELTSRGKVKVESKDAVKAKLPDGRSPDRADALCLSVFEPPLFEVGASSMGNRWG